MGLICRWSGKWRRKFVLASGKSFLEFLCFTLVIGIYIVGTVGAHQVTNRLESTVTGDSGKNESVDNDSGSWEYYYVDDDEDTGQNETFPNSDNSIQNATNRIGKFPNATKQHKDEYYYYMEEEVVMKNGSGPGKIVKTTTLKIDKTRKGLESRKKLIDSLKSGSMPLFGITDEIIPSMEPFKDLATPIQIEGPVFTDTNFGTPLNEYYQHSGPDSAVGKPLGVGELPPNPFTREEPVLLRPPPGPTQPPAESGLQLDVLKQVEYVDGVNDVNEGDAINNDVAGNEEDENKDNELFPGFQLKLPELHTKFKLEAYGSLAPEKNPIVKAKEFFNHLWYIISHFSTTELVLWAEKAFNLAAELAVPKDHYLRVISFAGIYLFVSMLTYGMQDVVDLMCTLETKDLPLKQWKYHAARRFVPARSVDPHMQQKFLKLFRGEKEDDEEEDELAADANSSSGSNSRSSEEDIADELDHINELCPEDAFFYSSNPRHIEAYSHLRRVLMAQESPKKFLKLAKRLLRKEKVHPKVWYFAIVGAFLSRQDLTGFSVPHPIDAIPDWFVPADLIEDLIKSYRKIKITKRSVGTFRNSTWMNMSTSKEVATALSFSKELDDEISIERLPIALPTSGNVSVSIVTTKKKKVVTTSTTPKSVGIYSLSLEDMFFGPPQSTENPVPIFPIMDDYGILFGTNAPNRVNTTTVKVKKVGKNKSGESKKTKKASKSKITGEKMLDEKKKKHKPTVSPAHQEKLNAAAALLHEHKTYKKGGNKGDNDDLVVVAPKNGNQTADGQGKPNEYLVDTRHTHHKGRHKKKGKKKKKCIKVNWKVGLDNGVENELWYWREDMMVNQHHWYWHQTHPFNTSTVHADRRAELFFFMHRNLVARYNAERISNGLRITQPLRFRSKGVVPPGYNSHLADINSGVYWTPRWPNTPLTDIHHEHDPDFASNISLAYYNKLCARITKSITSGQLLSPNGPPVRINHFKGIDTLANVVEASDVSINPWYYDTQGIHGLGHAMIGLLADPDFRFKRAAGVMADAAVSMRDPAFYMYHTFMDNIFELHKERLPPYQVVGGDFPLLWKGVKISKIELHSQGGAPKNELRTFWSSHKFLLSPGVDRSINLKNGQKHTEICAKHLDHEPFYFKIVIDRQPCVKSKSGKGTVRIFMAPRYDAKGRRIPVKVQRRLMFALDAFPVSLKVGRNTITRYAEDSSLTQPWTKHFRDFERGPDPSGAADFCGCGWPQHLYIPKGHERGMSFDLFVMVTSYDEDHVPNDPKILEIPETCNSPYLFCGLPRRRYPDRRPMGYPFDRPLFKSLNCAPGWTFSSVVCKSVNLVLNRPLDTLEEYVRKAPNMAMLKFHIRHLNKAFQEPSRHK